jgi:MFS family permease
MESRSPRQAPGRTLLVLGVGLLGFVLAQTTVIPALGEMQRDFGASASDIAWLVTAYLLVASIATPIFGRLGDMFGKQRLLAISLGLFAVGSLVSALADSLELMILGRGLQGLGGGVFPLCFGVVRDEFPMEKVPTGIAMLGAIAAIGSSIGLPLGGILADGPGYHWIFGVAAIMGVLATATTVLFVPASPIRTPGRVDFTGAAILGVALAALLVAISRGADWGWDSTNTVALMLVGFNGLALFGIVQRRKREPLVNMATFARRPVLTTNIATLLIGSAMISTFVLVPQLGQLPRAGRSASGSRPPRPACCSPPAGSPRCWSRRLSGASASAAAPRPRSSPAASSSPARCSGSRSPTTRSGSSSSGAASSAPAPAPRSPRSPTSSSPRSPRARPARPPASTRSCATSAQPSARRSPAASSPPTSWRTGSPRTPASRSPS